MRKLRRALLGLLGTQQLFSKSTIDTLEKDWRRYGVFIVNFERILHLCLVFVLLTLNKLMFFF